MDITKELKDAFIEEYSSAKTLKGMGRVKSSLILLSKSLFALCDYIILKKYGKLPKSHAERFRILQLKEHKLYSELDSVWSKYTDTYSKPSQAESYEMLDKAIRSVIENEDFEKEIKKAIEN